MRKILLIGMLAAGLSIIPVPAQAQARCGGQAVTFEGTDGPDVINATAGRDVIAAGAGDDIVFALGDIDVICPGDGNDIVDGGDGNDRVNAEAGLDGADQIRGGPGTDLVSYSLRSVGVTVVLDGVANDGSSGEGDNLDVEQVLGSAADDLLIGSAGPDALLGGSGDDAIRGALGGDSIQGGHGEDNLAGQGGDDFVYGDNGDDEFIAGAGLDGADVFEGGNGSDTANYSARFVALSINLDGVANDGEPGEGDNLRLDVENVIGGTQGDTIIARTFQPNPNRLAGGPGVDVLDSRDAPFITGDTVDGEFNVAICLTDPDDTRINCF
jgi:Ca2+-binding RTX toxin-like protein